MKGFLITLLLVFIFINMLAQTTPKGCNKVEVTSLLNAHENFEMISKLLLAEGFEIDKADEQTMTIKSGTKSIKGTYYYLYIFFDDRKIFITGKMRVLDLDFEQIRNKGMSGSPTKLAFNALVDFVNKIEGEKNFTVN